MISLAPAQGFYGRAHNLLIMKILALADLHGKFFRLDGIIRKCDPVDVVVVAGDLTHGGPAENAVRSISELKHICPRVYCVPGNFDTPEVAQAIGQYAVNLDETPRVIMNTEFMGLGYSTPTGNDTPSEISEETMAYKLDVLLSHTPAGKTVLVSHMPPLDTLDMTEKGPAGSKALRAALDRVDVIICGHIHKGRGKVRDGAWIINPGMAAEGKAAIIDLDTMEVIWIDSVV
jgi:Icc-related predicted phosphoesterase